MESRGGYIDNIDDCHTNIAHLLRTWKKDVFWLPAPSVVLRAVEYGTVSGPDAPRVDAVLPFGRVVAGGQ